MSASGETVGLEAEESKQQINLIDQSISPSSDAPSRPLVASASTKPSLNVFTFRGDGLSKRLANLVPSMSALLPSPDALPHRIRGRDLEPKVMVPYVCHDASQPPRRIAVERKKRECVEKSISLLLKNHSIDYSVHSPAVDHLTGSPCFLPLEMFDDQSFDCHSSEHWLKLSASFTIESNALTHSAHLVEAQALRLDSLGYGEYQRCIVKSYDVLGDKWTLQFHDSVINNTVHRLYVCFAAEDPVIYARRVAFAHAARRAAEIRLRRALYIDLMPQDELRMINSEQVNRMIFLASNTKKLRLSVGDTAAIVREIHLEHSRACNGITFTSLHSKHIEETKNEHLLSSLQPPECVKPNTNTPVKDFSHHFSDFCFHSFLTKREAVSALTIANGECLNLENLNVFVTHYSKNVRLEEFDQTQSNAIHSQSTFVRNKCLPSLAYSIKLCLKNIEKGWLNLSEQNREIYGYSKLRRLMLLFNLMITSSIRAAIIQSLQKYATLILTSCWDNASVNNSTQVAPNTTPKSSCRTLATSGSKAATSTSLEQMTQSSALFTVDIVFKDGSITYSAAPASLIATPLALFDSAFTAFDRLPQIESLILPHLFTASHFYLAAIHGQEPYMEVLRSDLEIALSSSIQPMYEYIKLYEPYVEILILNVDEHVKEFNRRHEDDLEAIKKEIALQLAKRAEMESFIPKLVRLGPVHVNCEDLKRKIINKYSEIINKQLDLLARWSRSRCEEINRQANKLESEMRSIPVNIPSLVKMKEWLISVPSSIQELKAQIRDAIAFFDALEFLQYRASKDLAKMRWTIFNAPKTLHECLEARQQALINDTAAFLAEMRSQQEGMNVEIHDAEKRVNALSHVHDVDNLEQLNENVEALQVLVQSIVTRSQQFNANELLLGIVSTDYRHINALQAALNSNYLLFNTALQWQNSCHHWRTCVFHELKSDEMVNQLATYNSRLNQLGGSKVIKESTIHSSLLALLLHEVNIFQPLLSLVLALRSEAMQPRHWKQLAKLLPFDLDPTDDTLTLTRLTDELGLMQWIETITEVSELAKKEYANERSQLVENSQS